MSHLFGQASGSPGRFLARMRTPLHDLALPDTEDDPETLVDPEPLSSNETTYEQDRIAASID